jgi:hypothetical protein
MAAVLGYKGDEFIAYFSDIEIGKEEGCDRFQEIPDNYIGEGGEIFYVKCTVETYFDDTLEFIQLTRSCKENLELFTKFTSKEYIASMIQDYLDTMSDEEKADIGEIIEPEDVIMEISLLNVVSYPDEY